jgi:hypothetical protein
MVCAPSFINSSSGLFNIEPHSFSLRNQYKMLRFHCIKKRGSSKITFLLDKVR